MRFEERVLDAYENMKLVRFDAIPQSYPGGVYWDDLPETDRAGVLKASFYENGKLKQYYSKLENHVGVIAATRLGKTTSYIIPLILSYSRQKKKRSMFITDPKGEIYRTTAETLRREGYKVILINFRNSARSECWNPFSSIFREYMALRDVGNTVEFFTEKGVKKARFFDRVYEDQKSLDEAVEVETLLRQNAVNAKIDDLSNMIVKVTKTDDIWDYAARDLFKAIVLGMLEDAELADNPITEDTFSLNTVLNILDSFVTGSRFDDGGFFSSRPSNSMAKSMADKYLSIAAEKTRDSYITTFRSKLSDYYEVQTRTITMANSLDWEAIARSTDPVAIFIDFRDELKSQYSTITLYVQDMYRMLIEAANDSPTFKLQTPWYFVLDEFGNFPAIKDFDTVISACAGRNIWFVLVLQSYAQLDHVYKEDVAKIIRDNLNVSVFFGSNNLTTLQTFSDECGNFTRFAPSSALEGGRRGELGTLKHETIPLMPRSKLCALKPGECVVREVNDDSILFSKMVRYFECDEMNSLPKAREEEYVATINPLKRKYNYRPKKRK